jgi:hypothetical protein
LGQVRITLGELVATPGQRMIVQMKDKAGYKNKSFMTIRLEELQESNEFAVVEAGGIKLEKMDTFGTYNYTNHSPIHIIIPYQAWTMHIICE